MKDKLQLKDVSTAEGQMVSIDLKDIPELPLDVHTMPWKPFTDEQKQNTACILDDVCVLNIPVPKNKEEEEELVNKFLNGMLLPRVFPSRRTRAYSACPSFPQKQSRHRQAVGSGF